MIPVVKPLTSSRPVVVIVVIVIVIVIVKGSYKALSALAKWLDQIDL